MKKANISCILCGSDKHSLIYSKDQWNVYKCDNCGLGMLEPRPKDDELNTLYQQEYFQGHYNNELLLDSPEMKKRLSQEKHRLRFFHKFMKKGKVLDIGCGRGYFLLACRKQGYEVEGIDISEDAADYVMTELKIKVHIGEANNITLPEKTFDVITLWHSLEHNADPNVCIQNACKWLKDEGILIVEVPNYISHDAQKMWDNWPGWSIPYHLYHFTKSSLISLLHKHGFTTVRSKHYLSENIKEKLEYFFIPSFIARVIARFYSGHSIAVVAKKTNNG